jgi:hypothetical protein
MILPVRVFRTETRRHAPKRGTAGETGAAASPDAGATFTPASTDGTDAGEGGGAGASGATDGPGVPGTSAGGNFRLGLCTREAGFAGGQASL